MTDDAPPGLPGDDEARRFADLLPDYLSGALPPADAAWVVAHVARHPASAQEVRWLRQMRAELRDEAAREPLQAGLEQLRARMRQAPSGAAAAQTAVRPAGPGRVPGAAAGPAPAVAPPARPSRTRPRWALWFAQPAGALATLVIVAQAGWIAWRDTHPPADLAWRGAGVEALQEAPPPATVRIALRLRAGAQAETLPALLAGHPGHRLVLEAPDRWVLEVPAADAVAALQAARAHPAVLQAEAP